VGKPVLEQLLGKPRTRWKECQSGDKEVGYEDVNWNDLTQRLGKMSGFGISSLWVQKSEHEFAGWLSTREIKRISATLKYFCCLIGNTAEAYSYCSSRSDGILQVWFSCLFVPSENSIKVAASLDVCSKDKLCAFMI
jgi:hypothetical protein